METTEQTNQPTVENSSGVTEKKTTSPLISGQWPGGWAICKRSIIDFFTNIVPWLVGLLATVPLALALVLGATFADRGASLNVLVLILGVIGGIALLFVGLCWFGATPIYGLARADGKKMTAREVYTVRWSIVWRLFVVSMLLVIPIFIGFLFFVIPGIILLIWLVPTFSLVPYVVVEENLDAMEAIKAAYRLSKGHEGKVWGILGWYFLISLVLLIPFIIILIATLHNTHTTSGSVRAHSANHNSSGGFGGGALSAISFAYLYRWIKQQPDFAASSQPPAITPTSSPIS